MNANLNVLVEDKHFGNPDETLDEYLRKHLWNPENETLREYYARRDYIGSFDDLSKFDIEALEREKNAATAIYKKAQRTTVSFWVGEKGYRRYPDGRIEKIVNG